MFDEVRQEIAIQLRERLKLRYMGNCKCGHCSLVPDELVMRAVEALSIDVYKEILNA